MTTELFHSSVMTIFQTLEKAEPLPTLPGHYPNLYTHIYDDKDVVVKFRWNADRDIVNHALYNYMGIDTPPIRRIDCDECYIEPLKKKYDWPAWKTWDPAKDAIFLSPLIRGTSGNFIGLRNEWPYYRSFAIEKLLVPLFLIGGLNTNDSTHYKCVDRRIFKVDSGHVYFDEITTQECDALFCGDITPGSLFHKRSAYPWKLYQKQCDQILRRLTKEPLPDVVMETIPDARDVLANNAKTFKNYSRLRA